MELNNTNYMNDFEKNNFADFTASSAMKDIGFDENCMAYYNGPQFLNCETIQDVKLSHNNMFAPAHDDISAPLFQQARKWFREKKELSFVIKWVDEGKFKAFIYFHNGYDWSRIVVGEIYDTEPDAYNAAIIKACEIVKEKQNG